MYKILLIFWFLEIYKWEKNTGWFYCDIRADTYYVSIEKLQVWSAHTYCSCCNMSPGSKMWAENKTNAWQLLFFFSSSQVSIIWKKFGTYSLLKPRKENKLYTAHFKEQPQLKSLVTINNVYSLALDLLAMLNYPL